MAGKIGQAACRTAKFANACRRPSARCIACKTKCPEIPRKFPKKTSDFSVRTRIDIKFRQVLGKEDFAGKASINGALSSSLDYPRTSPRSLCLPLRKHLTLNTTLNQFSRSPAFQDRVQTAVVALSFLTVAWIVNWGMWVQVGLLLKIRSVGT